MRELLVGVVEHGTGDNVYNTVYGIGGKTGTTQGISDKRIKNSSFVGFFPADNPRYTCLVLVERTSIAGRHAAAPVFKKIADCVVAFDEELGSIDLQDSGRVMRPVLAKGKRKQLENAHKLLGLPFTQVDSSRFTSWTVYDDARGVYDDYDVPQGVVPDCKGMTVRDAMALLRAAGLKVRFAGQGKVVSQSPKARTAVGKGATVTLELKP
jgi:cell division protein FtsI (penicillin-binding protein 3)